MTSEVRLLLDSMFLRDETATSQSPFLLTLLKRLSQSTRPTKIRERQVDLGVMKELHAKVAPILSVLNLGSEGIRYFAGSVARMRRLRRRVAWRPDLALNTISTQLAKPRLLRQFRSLRRVVRGDHRIASRQLPLCTVFVRRHSERR
jgi:hypothetical protein